MGDEELIFAAMFADQEGKVALARRRKDGRS